MKQNASLKYYLDLFEGKWDKSLDRRIEACEAYAYACDTFGSDVKAQFRDRYQTQNWRPHQWTVIYLVGTDKLAPEWLDYKNTSVPLAMATRKLDLDTQYEIYEGGLDLFTLNGNTIHVTAASLKVSHISQAFHKNGTPRTQEEQIQWLEEHQITNIVVNEDGSIDVHHKCHITKRGLIGLLKNNPAPLTAAEHREIADFLDRRN